MCFNKAGCASYGCNTTDDFMQRLELGICTSGHPTRVVVRRGFDLNQILHIGLVLDDVLLPWDAVIEDGHCTVVECEGRGFRLYWSVVVIQQCGRWVIPQQLIKVCEGLLRFLNRWWWRRRSHSLW